MVGGAGIGGGELTDIQRSTVVASDDSKIFCPLQMGLLKRRVAGELADDAGVGQHPVMVAWNQPAGGNAADHPAGRLAVTRRAEKNIARRQRHRSTGNSLYQDGRSVR